MTQDTIITSVSDNISHIRINRPEKKNSLTMAMYEALTQALQQGEADEKVKVHVITGVPTQEGTKGCFCAGNDIGDFINMAMSGHLGQPILDFLMALTRTEKPLVAGIDGVAVGIGTTMLFHCDMAYATPNATFSTPFTNLALVPEAASSILGPRILGAKHAFDLLCMGTTFDAERAAATGLVNEIVSSSDLMNKVIDSAKALSKKPPQALKMARQLVRYDQNEIEGRIVEEAEQFKACLQSPEAKEAFTAFIEKRAPNFDNL